MTETVVHLVETLYSANSLHWQQQFIISEGDEERKKERKNLRYAEKYYNESMRTCCCMEGLTSVLVTDYKEVELGEPASLADVKTTRVTGKTNIRKAKR